MGHLLIVSLLFSSTFALETGLIGGSLADKPAGAASGFPSGGNFSVLSIGNNPTGGSSLIAVAPHSNAGGVSVANIGTDPSGLHVGLLDIGGIPSVAGGGSANANTSSAKASSNGNNPSITIKKGAFDYESSGQGIKYASRIHGSQVILQDQNAMAFREGDQATVWPQNNVGSEWVHFALPTPVVLNGDRLGFGAATIRFRTGKNARISSWWVHDSDHNIANQDLNLTGDYQVATWTLDKRPVSWGALLSLLVQFDPPKGPDAWIKLMGAGVDFVVAKS